MILAKAMRMERSRERVKIYATDVDDDALGVSDLDAFLQSILGERGVGEGVGGGPSGPRAGMRGTCSLLRAFDGRVRGVIVTESEAG